MSAERERTEDVRIDVAEFKRRMGLDINRLALSDGFESTTYTPKGVGVISVVNVSSNVVIGTQTGT
jgi:hypothetical protein